MMKLHFPHISRLFSANKSIPFTLTLCWSILTACIIFNARISSVYGSVTHEVEDTMTKKADVAAHRRLSDRFEKSGIPAVARELRRSTDSLFMSDTVTPGERTVLGSLTHTLEYWEQVIAEHPDYRDAYLTAAKSALAQNDTGKALWFTKLALEIDPNDTAALVIETLLGKNIPE